MRRPRRLLPATILPLALLLGGCAPFAGDQDDPAADGATEKVSAADRACRQEWKALGEKVDDQAGAGSDADYPSSLPTRRTSVSATLDYYAAGATASDCGSTLDAQTAQLAAIDELSTALRRYDVAWQHDRLAEDAEAYTPPKPRKGAKGAEPPTAKAVSRALTTLEDKAPRATKDQLAGWQQAAAIDPRDAKATAKAKKDLAFLSSESAAWRQARTAQRLVERALRVAG